MKKNLLFLVMIIATILFVGCKGSEVTLTEFTPEDGSFTASFPGEPTLESTSLPGPQGDIGIDMYMVQGEELLTIVSKSVFEGEQTEDDDTVLNNACQGALLNTNGQNDKKEDITLGDYPGKHLTYDIKTPEGVVLKVTQNIYLVDNSIYQTQTIVEEGKLANNSDTIEKFLASLVINK